MSFPFNSWYKLEEEMYDLPKAVVWNPSVWAPRFMPRAQSTWTQVLTHFMGFYSYGIYWILKEKFSLQIKCICWPWSTVFIYSGTARKRRKHMFFLLHVRVTATILHHCVFSRQNHFTPYTELKEVMHTSFMDTHANAFTHTAYQKSTSKADFTRHM